MDKQNVVFPYNRKLFSHKWNKILGHATTKKTFKYRITKEPCHRRPYILLVPLKCPE
jgi:hypothetical protein